MRELVSALALERRRLLDASVGLDKTVRSLECVGTDELNGNA